MRLLLLAHVRCIVVFLRSLLGNLPALSLFVISFVVEAKRLEEERIANELAEKRAQEEARAARVAQLARLADVRARAHDAPNSCM